MNVAAAAQHPADGGFAEIGGREADDEIGMQHPRRKPYKIKL